MNWKEGDIAICINNGHIYDGPGAIPPLRLNSEYIVHKVHKCECGHIKLDVGIFDNSSCGVRCKCAAVSSPTSGIWWSSSERFKKKDLRTKEEQIEEAVKEENYELAEQLKNP